MLFEIDQPMDNSPIERLNISYVQLFYTDQDVQQFKELCKRGMVKMWPDGYANKNISDFIFELVKTYNDTTRI